MESAPLFYYALSEGVKVKLRPNRNGRKRGWTMLRFKSPRAHNVQELHSPRNGYAWGSLLEAFWANSR
jgi:hypothetical protein